MRGSVSVLWWPSLLAQLSAVISRRGEAVVSEVCSPRGQGWELKEIQPTPLPHRACINRRAFICLYSQNTPAQPLGSMGVIVLDLVSTRNKHGVRFTPETWEMIQKHTQNVCSYADYVHFVLILWFYLIILIFYLILHLVLSVLVYVQLLWPLRIDKV